MSNPDEAAARGLWSDPRFLERRRRPEPAGAAHPVRRLPRPRLGLPRRLQEGPQGQPARPRRPHDRRRRPPSSSWRRSPCPSTSRSSTATAQGRRPRPPRRPTATACPSTCWTSTWKRGCTASIATSCRTSTATPSSTARSAPPSRSSASTATARPTSGPTLLTTGPAPTPRGRTGRRPRPGGPAHPLRQAPVRAQRRQAHPELDGRAGPAPGRSSRPPTRSTPRAEHYNEKSHLAKTVRFDADGQMVWGDLPGGQRERLRPRQQQHELHRLPLVLEPELLRLPSAAEGQQEDAQLCTTRATSRATTSPTTSRRCATTSSCWPATAT